MPPRRRGWAGKADIDLAFFQVARQRLAADQVLTFIVSLAEFTLQRINLLAEGSAFVLAARCDQIVLKSLPTAPRRPRYCARQAASSSPSVIL